MKSKKLSQKERDDKIRNITQILKGINLIMRMIIISMICAFAGYGSYSLGNVPVGYSFFIATISAVYLSWMIGWEL